jgi:GNAT superfamily N-acetyltransferase
MGGNSLMIGLRREDLQIRDAYPGDREAIRQVTLSAFQEYASAMPSRWEEYRRHILETLADVKSAEQIVAEHDGAILGTILLYPAGTTFSRPGGAPSALAGPEVRLLAVAPAARAQGIGTALMRECIRRARRSGAPVLTLHTTDRMSVAMRMYERMGFVRAPELDFQVDEELTVKGYRLKLE